jgi:L-serine dehydratase
MMGLEGETPDQINPDIIQVRVKEITEQRKIKLLKQKNISFDVNQDLLFNIKDLLPTHTNGMRFSAFDEDHTLLNSQIFYSIGGGFIINDETTPPFEEMLLPYPFSSAKELLFHCKTHDLSIKEIMLANECAKQPRQDVEEKLLNIANVMRECIKKGCQSKGILPGGLKVKRRAAELFQRLNLKGQPRSFELTDSMSWLNLYAIAVNEENAAGSRVVTAPTNGAAGVVPAVLHYYLDFYPDTQPEDAIDFLLVAGAIAILYKKGASISGAEVGCQGEVGVACSMAAGALTAMLGGTIDQIENAAEIAMEHHLGMTCDPIAGLVQIPCIERNAMGAVKAVNAARLALLGDGQHFVSLDKVIATMKQTGKDMLAIYKETSLGGLAANIPEC